MASTSGKTGRQLPLPFTRAQAAGASPPFLASPTNETARRLAETWIEGLNNGAEGGQGIIVAGPRGSGKSHFLQTLADSLQTTVHEGPALCDRSQPLPEAGVIVIDNADACQPSDLMRLINVMVERGRLYILAGTGKPQDWAGEDDDHLTDLASRLSATPTAMLEKPDEPLMAETIRVMLASRQVKISAEVAATAAARLKRNFHAVENFVDTVDSVAMERQKTIDRALVNQVLTMIPDAVI